MLKSKKNNGEKGTAVIIALGICALVLALALNFATQSILSEKMAVNVDNRARAGLLVRSAMDRALSGVKASEENGLQLENLYSSSDESDTKITDYTATVNGIDYYGSPNTEWQDIYSQDKLIGRVAFTACWPDSSGPGQGRLVPSACIDQGYYDTAVTEDTYLYTGTNSNGSKVLGRPGVNVNEIYLMTLDKSFYRLDETDTTEECDTYLQKISAVNADNSLSETYAGELYNKGYLEDEIINTGTLPVGEQWVDVNTLIKNLDLDITSDTAQRLSQRFVTDVFPDPEVFWIDSETSVDSPGFGRISRDELYHRFNIARTDWPSSENAVSWIDTNIFGDTEAFITDPTTATDGNCIPWLKNWKLSYNTGVDTAYKYQVAANLVDYSDANSAATTDDEDNPSFTGNDKSPYINEVRVTLLGRVYKIFGYTYYLFRFRSIDVELVNIYDNNGGTYTADIQGTISYTFRGENKSIDIDNEKTVVISEDSYYGVGTKLNIGIDSFDIAREKEVPKGITNVKIDNLKIKLTNNDGSEFYDFSYVDNESDSVDLVSENNTGYKLQYFDYEANDPRQNLHESNWVPNFYSGTLLAKNSICDPSSGDDDEADTEPYNISTAYIRNAPMESPWELGFIHRGAMWQTMNLKKYNSFDQLNGGVLPGAGGDSYESGDANILDQIKMTSSTSTYGKVNLNNSVAVEDVFKPLVALFYGVYYGLDKTDIVNNIGYNSTDSSKWITSSEALSFSDLIQGSILADKTIDADSMFKTRAELTRNKLYYIDENGDVDSEATPSMEGFTDGTIIPQSNDAEQEELIGKFINLTKAQNNIFDYGNEGINLLLYSQSVKQNPAGEEEIMADRKAFVTLKQNPFKGSWEVKRFEYLQ